MQPPKALQTAWIKGHTLNGVQEAGGSNPSTQTIMKIKRGAEKKALRLTLKNDLNPYRMGEKWGGSHHVATTNIGSFYHIHSFFELINICMSIFVCSKSIVTMPHDFLNHKCINFGTGE